MKKTSKPKVGQIFSRLEYSYYNARMNKRHVNTNKLPKRLPRKLKKALKAKSKPTHYRITSIVKSGGIHRATLNPQ